MADTTPYVRAYSFTNFQQDMPDTPLPGTRLDIELDNIAAVTRQLSINVNAWFDIEADLSSVVTVAGEIDRVVFVANNMDAVLTVASQVNDWDFQGAKFKRQQILTNAGQRRYLVNTAGDDLGLNPENHVLFGGSPFGPLTYGVDYTTPNGNDLLLNFDPTAGELLHVHSMPRYIEAPGSVKADADRAEAAAGDAEIARTGAVVARNEAVGFSTPFASYADALAYAPTAPTAQTRLSAIVSGILVEWVRDASAPCLGGGWAPAGVATPLHFGATGDNTTNDAPAFIAAMNYRAEVFVPAAISNYFCWPALNLNSNQHLYGASFNVAKLRFVDTNGLVSGDGNENVKINDLQIHGNGAAATIGVHVIGNVRRTLIDNVKCFGFGLANAGAGILLQDSDFGGANPVGDMWGAYIRNCNTEYCGRGIVLNQVRAVTLENNINRLCYGDTFVTENCVAVTVIAGAHENSNNTVPGGVASSWSARLKNSRGITLIGFDCENMVSGLILLDNSHACHIDMHGGTAEAGATMLRLINGSSGNTITGSTGDLWNASHTGIFIEAGCNDNDIGPFLVAEPGLINATAIKVVDNGTNNRLNVQFGDGSPSLRKTPSDENGTFTPTLTFGGASAGMTGTFIGEYVKTGNLVHVVIQISLTNKGTSTGAAAIGFGNLGYVPERRAAAVVADYFNFVDLPAAQMNGVAVAAGNSFALKVPTATTSANVTETKFANNSFITITSTFNV